MSAKRKLPDNRTILTILILLLIVVGAYYFITNAPPAKEWISVEDALRNKEHYVSSQSTITIRGYYILDNNPSIVSKLSTDTSRAILEIDYSSIKNASDNLIENTAYDFTGVLVTDETANPFGEGVILVLDKFDRV